MSEKSKKLVKKSNKKPKKLNMAWFKFLVYFLLWVSAAFNLFIGAYYISKNIDDAGSLGFQYGIMCCVLFVLFLVTTYLLVTYNKHADGFLYTCYVFDIFISLLYAFLYVRANPGCELLVCCRDALISAAGSFVMLITNMIYFSRRDHLFIN